MHQFLFLMGPYTGRWKLLQGKRLAFLKKATLSSSTVCFHVVKGNSHFIIKETVLKPARLPPAQASPKENSTVLDALRIRSSGLVANIRG